MDHLKKIIGEAVGAGSMCWDNPGGAGEFQSERASRVVDRAVTSILQKYQVTERYQPEEND